MRRRTPFCGQPCPRPQQGAGNEVLTVSSPSILPVLIGADMNCYSVARAFHEAYGIESYAFGRWPMGDTMYSKIVHCTYIVFSSVTTLNPV